ncbi:hypothetical protein [Conexibacter woesei]|uniref:Uncharacterized protein n=1 Tax=Conexibacter woesei (strain DSM 14684 / CCUG 47730 / CIP 108061 / JCM 11494 / NBRC 100937 / ID131577) TaxID=469383 RepID=D3EYV2_CONWI|nr:hypothetical protein [Conexibacter woesei]ADB49826.1 hypothetical protein Cwoe_1398 [Conexibacter woesei DSM 14684]
MSLWRAAKDHESGPAHAFPLDLHEVSHLGLNDVRDAIVITAWTPERGVWTVARRQQGA